MSPTSSSHPFEPGTGAVCASVTSPSVVGAHRQMVRACLSLVVAGALLFGFAFATVHRLDGDELSRNPVAYRSQYALSYWLQHGYFSSGGLAARPNDAEERPGYYVSSSGGQLVSGFAAERLWVAASGHYSYRLLALHNQAVSLVAAALVGLLAFRLARRLDVPPLRAIALGVAVEAVVFTFPDNLASYWEMSGRTWFLVFAAVFLLIEERSDVRTRTSTRAQGAAAFLLTYLDLVTGICFLTAFLLVCLMLDRDGRHWRRHALRVAVPALAALAVVAGQLAWVRLVHPEIPRIGSGFLFRSGLDGSSLYYGDHLDIAFGRDVARANFRYNRAHLFRWPWLFTAGTIASLGILLAFVCRRVPRIAIVPILSLAGGYLFYAAVFSQAVAIHPYLYDVLIFTPLVLALFAVAPSVVESMTEHRGVVVLAAVMLAVWVSMLQMRRYALQYPSAPAAISALPVPVR